MCRSRITGFAVMCLALLTAGCTVHREQKVSEKATEAAKTAATEEISDPKALMPEWYRHSLKADFSVSTDTKREGAIITTETKTEKAEPTIRTPLLNSSLWLGLFVFPLVAGVVVAREVFPQRGSFYMDEDEARPILAVAVFVMGAGVPYLISLLLGGIIALGSKSVCPLMAGHGTYVPFHYALFASQWFVILLTTGFVCFLYILYPLLPLLKSGGRESIPEDVPEFAVPSPALRSFRLHRMAHAAVKALCVAAATSVGSQVAAWVGGIVAVVVAAVMAAWAEPAS